MRDFSFAWLMYDSNDNQIAGNVSFQIHKSVFSKYISNNNILYWKWTLKVALTQHWKLDPEMLHIGSSSNHLREFLNVLRKSVDIVMAVEFVATFFCNRYGHIVKGRHLKAEAIQVFLLKQLSNFFQISFSTELSPFYLFHASPLSSTNIIRSRTLKYFM